MRRVLWGMGIFFFLSGCVGKPLTNVEKPVTNVERSFTNKELVEMFARRQLDAREKEPGVILTLPETVFFAFASADLSLPARQKIDVIAEVLNHSRATQLQIAIVGYADAIGTDKANLALSQRRAEAVAQELIANRVRRERLRTQGLGESSPIAPNTKPDGSDNPEGRAKNRRVEVIISH